MMIPWRRRLLLVLLALSTSAIAAVGRVAPAAESDAEKPGAKLSDTWSRVIPVSDPPDAKYGEWRVWVQDGWLLAERRTGDDELEWKIVLAEVVGDEPPEIFVNRMPQGARVVRRDSKGVEAEAPGPEGPIPGSLRLSYRDGRYFIRDGFGSLRCFRQAKGGDDAWPNLELPPRDPQGFGSGMAGTRASVLTAQTSNSWITALAGPQAAMRQVNQRMERTLAADCLVRLTHKDLREEREPLRYSGGEVASARLGDWFLIDEGDLLMAKKLDAWQLPNALIARVRSDPAFGARLVTDKLGSAAAIELPAKEWLNADGPATLKGLRGMPVVMVLFDLNQQSFRPLVPPLMALGEMYGAQGLKIIGIHAQAPREEVEKRLAEEKITFPVLIDGGKAENRFGIGFSACILIDREGKVASVYKDLLAPPAEIEKLLEGKDR